MKKSNLQELAVSMFMVVAVLLPSYSPGQDAPAVKHVSTPEQTYVKEQQEADENSPPKKTLRKKRGRVRIATLGPRPFPADADTEPQDSTSGHAPTNKGGAI